MLLVNFALQIRPMGDQENCCRDHRYYLASCGFCVFCANLIFPPPSGAATCVRGQGRKRVSNVRTWSHTNVCSCVQLYKFLRTLHSYDRNLLQVFTDTLVKISSSNRPFLSPDSIVTLKSTWKVLRLFLLEFSYIRPRLLVFFY